MRYKLQKIIVIMLCILCLCLSGCDDGKKAEFRDSYGVKPNMIIYGKDEGNAWFSYVVDERTGVVYILGGGGQRGYMAPALNADGTPMLKDQLKEIMREIE